MGSNEFGVDIWMAFKCIGASSWLCVIAYSI